MRYDDHALARDELEQSLGDDTMSQQPLPAHDYVSPGLDVVIPDLAFPDMVVGDTSNVDWPFLRRWVQHNWYTDLTSPTTGFANRDEVSILYNNALLFAGQHCLEIGCWRGWSAVHIAKADCILDVIDPLLAEHDISAKVERSFKAAGVADRITLHSGFSPAAVDALAQSTGRQWSFFFVDGNHDEDAPLRDAEAVLRHASPTAMVLFHDLTSPHVAAGLRVFRDAGWRTMVYQTMQIMGVAWRGNTTPVHHVPDPEVCWTLPRHIEGYEVSGWSSNRPTKIVGWWSGMTLADRLLVAQLRAQSAEDGILQARLERADMQGEVDKRDVQVREAYAEAIEATARLDAALQQTSEALATADVLEAERDAALDRAIAADTSHSELSTIVAGLSASIPNVIAIEAERNRLVTVLDEANRELEALHVVKAANDSLLAERDEFSWRAERAEERIKHMRLTRALQEARVHELRMETRRVSELAKQEPYKMEGLRSLARWTAQKRVILGLVRRSALTRIAILQARTRDFGVSDVVVTSAIHAICRRRTLIGLFRRSTKFSELLVLQILLQSAMEVRQHAAASVCDDALVS